MNGFDINKIDKSKWKKYPFEQIAFSISKRVEPKDTELEIYVGLEHLDAESVHIKRTGVPSDVEGTKLLVYPGDVIFGKRRAYQRKAAIATFEGICSAHAMVLRANEKVIDKNLFPFFLHSDYFMHRAIDISVGSLSPTINWGTLKTQEFLLPPKDQQARLAELLWAADEVVEGYQKLELRLQKTIKTLIDIELSIDSTNNIKWNYRALNGFLKSKPQYGANSSAIPYKVNKPRYIRITDIDDEGTLIPTDIMTTDLEEYNSYLLKEGDFLFARTGNTVGKTYLYKEEDGFSVFAGYLIRCILNKDYLLPEFLALFCKSSKYEEFKTKVVKVGAQPNINAEQYANMLIPDTPIEKQKEIVLQHKTMSNGLTNLRNSMKSAMQIQKQLINQIFSA